MSDEPSAYGRAVAQRNEINKRIDMVETNYHAEMRRLKAELAREAEIIIVAERGFDAEQFVTARSIVAIQWGRARDPRDNWSSVPTGPRRVTPETREQLLVAIERFRNDDLDAFDTEYLGIKSYDRWDSQTENHQHHRGPRHGSIWWRLSLHRKPETEAERLACIAWLTALIENPELLP
jgi:hypothetical protein